MAPHHCRELMAELRRVRMETESHNMSYKYIYIFTHTHAPPYIVRHFANKLFVLVWVHVLDTRWGFLDVSVAKYRACLWMPIAGIDRRSVQTQAIDAVA